MSTEVDVNLKDITALLDADATEEENFQVLTNFLYKVKTRNCNSFLSGFLCLNLNKSSMKRLIY